MDQTDSYDAIDCNIQGADSFSAGVYQIRVSAYFSRAPSVRSVEFVFDDDDADTETHVKLFPVGLDNPSVKASYNASQTDSYGTLENLALVGSGSFDLTKYDRSALLFSGTFDIIVKQGSAQKNITGTLTDVPMQAAE